MRRSVVRRFKVRLKLLFPNKNEFAVLVSENNVCYAMCMKEEPITKMRVRCNYTKAMVHLFVSFNR